MKMKKILFLAIAMMAIICISTTQVFAGDSLSDAEVCRMMQQVQDVSLTYSHGGGVGYYVEVIVSPNTAIEMRGFDSPGHFYTYNVKNVAFDDNHWGTGIKVNESTAIILVYLMGGNPSDDAAPSVHGVFGTVEHYYVREASPEGLGFLGYDCSEEQVPAAATREEAFCTLFGYVNDIEGEPYQSWDWYFVSFNSETAVTGYDDMASDGNPIFASEDAYPVVRVVSGSSTYQATGFELSDGSFVVIFFQPVGSQNEPNMEESFVDAVENLGGDADQMVVEPATQETLDFHEISCE
ncbi:MAG: hypothetical protein ABI721_03805 [Candidatus Dojkabacteria bacterium]